MRVSTFQSPGYAGSSSTGMVFRYGVVVAGGTSIPAARSRSTRLSSRTGACSEPCFFRTYSSTYSSDSNHLRASKADCFLGASADLDGPPDWAGLAWSVFFDFTSAIFQSQDTRPDKQMPRAYRSLEPANASESSPLLPWKERAGEGCH